MSNFRRRIMLQDKGIDLSKDWLRFDILEDGTVGFTSSAAVHLNSINHIDYSINGRKWIKNYKQQDTAISISIPVVAGDVVYWKGEANGYADNNSWYSNFSSTANYTVSGNIMSLLYDTDFEDKVEFPNHGRIFQKLFKNNTKLLSCENLKLPATTLRSYCYGDMFSGCSALTKVSANLPATALTDNCCLRMFNNTAITSAPNMDVSTTQANSCQGMFSYSKLVDASNIIIRGGASKCCYEMFNSCTSLVTGPQILFEEAKTTCLSVAFTGCSKLSYLKCLVLTDRVNGTSIMASWMQGAKNNSSCVFVKHINSTWTTTGASGVLANWKIIYFDPTDEKYYLDKNKETECDDHGNTL